MGKKKNKKFKKVHSTNQSFVVDPSGDKVSSIKEYDSAASTKVIKKTEPADELTEAERERYAHVRREVKKVVLMLSVSVLIIVGLYFLQNQTGALDNFGSWLYRIANVQTP